MNTSPFSVDSLSNTLSQNPNLPVVFTLNGQRISQGYHLTEIKLATVESLDCGQGLDHWNELSIQLLDGDSKSSAGFMKSKKLQAILLKALGKKPQPSSYKLYFEFAPGNRGLQKSIIESIDIVDKRIVISLNSSPATCKPFQRWLNKASNLIEDDQNESNTTRLRSGSTCCSSKTVESGNNSCCS